MIHNNTSITDTHRITYLQISVSGKAKDLIHAYSCDPSYYQTALNELMRHFGDRTIVANAFINQHENWQMNFQKSKAFPHFWKDLCKTSITLTLQQTSRLQHSLGKPQRKHHIIWFSMDWTFSYRAQLRSDSCGLSAMVRAPSSNLWQSESRKQSKNHQFSSLQVCQ